MGMRDLTREGLVDRRDQLAGPIGVEQAQQRGGDGAEILAACGGLARTPGRGLGIEVSEIAPGASGKEGVADGANGALHAPLLIAPRHGDGPRLEAVVRRQGQQRRMEPDRLALALDDRAFQIIVEEDAG
jgi:hypothetical protein